MLRHSSRSFRWLLTVWLAAISTSVAPVSFTSPAAAKESCPGQPHATVLLPDPVSGRRYEIYVSLPDGYDKSQDKRFPLLVLADGGRAFRNLSCDARALAEKGTIGEEPLVVGLSYAAGESLEDSRRRDYTPVALKPDNGTYGGAAAYQTYIRDVVLNYVEANYRTNPRRRIFWGHSYGALLGAHILQTEPSYSKPTCSAALPSGLPTAPSMTSKKLIRSGTHASRRLSFCMLAGWRRHDTIPPGKGTRGTCRNSRSDYARADMAASGSPPL